MPVTSRGVVGVGIWHKLLQNKGPEVVHIVDSYSSLRDKLGGFVAVTCDRAWRKLSIAFLVEMERKNGAVYAVARKMKSGGQGSIVFMHVYLHHKYPENFWHHDPSIILQNILDTLNLKDPVRTEISKYIETAVNHVHIWHKKSRISSAFHSTASKQGFINSTSGDGTPIQSKTISSNISSTSSAMRPEHTQINNHACSIQSELSLVQDLLLLLRAREGSNFPIDGCSFVCTYLFEISSFAHVLQIHNQISTTLPMLAGITHEFNKEKSQVVSLIAHAAEFIKVVMMPDEPTMVRSCFLCTFMV